MRRFALSTFRSPNLGSLSHCPGVGFMRTSPLVAVLMPWWITSTALIFESSKVASYTLLNTKKFSPRASK